MLVWEWGYIPLTQYDTDTINCVLWLSFCVTLLHCVLRFVQFMDFVKKLASGELKMEDDEVG